MVGSIGGEYPAVYTEKGLSSGMTARKIETNLENKAPQETMNQTQSKAVQKEELEKIVSGMNDFLKASPNTHLKFQFHDKLNEYYVTIVDEQTQEVVKEIPPKKMLDMFAAMTEFLGIMVDKKI